MDDKQNDRKQPLQRNVSLLFISSLAVCIWEQIASLDSLKSRLLLDASQSSNNSDYCLHIFSAQREI